MDSYTRCECGSGEKYKFCCQKAEAYIRKVDRQIESNLDEAAAATLEEGLKKYPDTPSLLIRRALLAASNGGDDDQAARALEAYLAKHPRHLGVRNMLILMTLRSEGPESAALELQRIVSRLSDEERTALANLAGRIAEAFMDEAKPVAGIAHSLLRFLWTGGQSGSVRSLLEMQQSQYFSLWERNAWNPLPADDSVPAEIRDEFTDAYDKSIHGEWLDAAEIFGRIASRDTSARSYRNQGLCMAMMGENFTAVACLRAYVAALGETDEAVDFEALCQEIEPAGDEDLIDRLQLTWTVRSLANLVQLLDASDHFVEFELDEQQAEKTEGKQVKTYAVLDRPKLKSVDAIDLDKVPRVVATVMLDERNASVAAIDDGQLDATTELFREAAGAAIVPAHPRTKHLGKVPRQNPMDDFRWILPDDISEDARKDFFDRRFIKDLETVWTVTPRKYLGRRTPEKAAADGDAKVALRAALLRLSESRHGEKAVEAIEKLRSRLGVPKETAPDPESIDRIPVARLPLVDLKALSSQRLAIVFDRAVRYFLPEVLKNAGEEWLSRPIGDAADAQARIKVYQELIHEAIARNDMPRALELIARGQAEDNVHSPDVREIFWGLAAISARAHSHDPSEWVPELAVLLDRRRGDDKAEDEIGQMIVVKLMELGLIRLVPHPDRPEQMMMDTRILEYLLQKYGPKITTATGELGVSASKSKIWTPGATGSPAGGSNKIWTPGQPSSGKDDGGSKLFVPGK
jgi:hypothetical protein